MSKFNQYRTFITVVEQGSITLAANVLNLSVPAISKQLSQLEESLQTQLFYRAHKKLDITNMGKQFYPKCKAILASVSQAEEALLSEQSVVCGELRVTLSKSLCRSQLMTILADFAHHFPAIQLHLHYSDELADLYASDIDFAFRLGQLDDSNMVAKPLADLQLVACATRQYLQKHGTPTDFSDLGSAQFILPSSLNPNGELKAFLNKHRFDFGKSVAHYSNDIEGIYQLTQASLGIGLFLDVSVSNELASGQFVSLFCDHGLPTKRLYLLAKKDQWQLKKYRVFKEFMVASSATMHVGSCK